MSHQLAGPQTDKLLLLHRTFIERIAPEPQINKYLIYESWILTGFLVFNLTLQLIKLDQPILENYVGRQIPTAMVARNLARGGSFLKPQLDTLPSPNLFLVEPPIFGQLTAWVHRLTSLPIGTSGRLISALATTLAGWGIYRLARAREGFELASFSLLTFAVLPVTLRYGRACQPEMLMLGLLIGGMAVLDSAKSTWVKILGLLLISVGLAVKITGVYLLVPLGFIGWSKRENWVRFVIVCLVPAALWYGHAWTLLTSEVGSQASADNGAIWVRSVIPSALFDPSRLLLFAKYLTYRCFTPIGLLVGLVGLYRGDRLYKVWGLAALLMLGGLAAKAHHEYYWVALAPVIALGVGRALAELTEVHRPVAFGIMAGLMLVAGYQTRTTWKTPPEWSVATDAVAVIDRLVPQGEPLVASEALLYLADRKGYRLEIDHNAQERAAGEWGRKVDLIDEPGDLIEFYERQGARYFVDLIDKRDERRKQLHETIREKFTTLHDESGVLIALLERP